MFGFFDWGYIRTRRLFGVQIVRELKQQFAGGNAEA